MFYISTKSFQLFGIVHVVRFILNFLNITTDVCVMTCYLLSMQATTLLVESDQYTRVVKYATTEVDETSFSIFVSTGHPFLSICPEISSFLRYPTVRLIYNADR